MKVTYLESEETIEDLIPGIGVPEGDTFEAWAIDLKEHQINPFCTALGIPSGLRFANSDLFSVFPNVEEHEAFTRFQICKWLYLDEYFTKPVHLIGATSLNEIRMLSGIPNIESIILGSEVYDNEDIATVDLLAAAGDERLWDWIPG